MKLLAIDPGNSMGLSCWNDGELVDSFIWKFKSQVEAEIHLPHFINDYVHINNIEKIVYEDPVENGKRGNNLIKLAKKCGIIIAVASLKFIECHSFNTSKLQTFIGATGKTESKKKRIKQWVIEKYGEEHAKTQDQADAVAIGYSYIKILKELENKNESK